ncbi:MAG: 2-isopropylmalate synthase [bacterium]|nr:2-isopropylmalate synthase [bacterium]
MHQDKMNLLHPWNRRGNEAFPREFQINDETLRDGIQAAGIRQPSLENKIKIVDYINGLGIEAACVGFPAAGPAMMDDLEHIIGHIRDNRYTLRPACAARTVESDIAPVAELSQKLGVSIDANVFVGSSPIRQVVEHWSLDHILGLVKKAVTFGVKHNVPINFITEDTTRSKPEHIRAIYETAVECGAYRVCICDTVGYATPDGTSDLIHYVRSFLEQHDKKVLIDWHGHNDRGLGLANVLAALQAGVNRVHVTCLGIGERTGNVSMEQLMMNLKLMGLKDFDPILLKKYCHLVSEACEVPIPGNMPLFGEKAFATSTGVHAAAIIKAKKMKDDWLADNIYSSVPAGELGLEQKIEIGPLCGKSNVIYFLSKHGIENDAMVDEMYTCTKEKGKNLSTEEISAIFTKYGYEFKEEAKK